MPTEKAVVVDWTPPVAEPGMPPLSFNVYRREAADAPINPSPLADAKFEIGGVEYGKEQCFVVRTVQTFENVTLESAPSAPACLTPLDKFPPAAPKGLRAVAEDNAISLVWDQNAEARLRRIPGVACRSAWWHTAAAHEAADHGRELPRRHRQARGTIRLRRGRRGHGHAEEQSAPSAREEVTAR